MDDLHSIRATCHFMRRVCSEPKVGWRVALEWFTDDMAWHNPDGYNTLLAHVTLVCNSKA
jgi:hypothetical protein